MLSKSASVTEKPFRLTTLLVATFATQSYKVLQLGIIFSTENVSLNIQHASLMFATDMAPAKSIYCIYKFVKQKLSFDEFMLMSNVSQVK